jgi:hypothetical protein
MRVEVSPRQLSAKPGSPATITVQVTNTRTVISGHRVRVLGVDPEWISVDASSLSLFPDAVGTAVVTVTLPEGVPAGTRHLSVEVTELTPPADTEVVDIELTVPADLGLTLELDPSSVTGGRSVTTGLLIANSGNSAVDVELSGSDDEGEVEFAFTPPVPTLQPGEQLLTSVTLTAHRPWLGSPKVRPFTVSSGPHQAPVKAFGAWVQKAWVSRGALALAGLAAAITVFAIVLTASLAQVVNTSAADRDLALQVAEAARSTATSGTASISGTVTLLSSNAPLPGVTAQLYQASNTASPIVSTATGPQGQYQFSHLVAGSYKVEFIGAGFSQIWYPASLTAANATPVDASATKPVTGINVRLGGLPGTISGTVVGADPAGATLTLALPGPGSLAAIASPTAAATAASNAGNAVVTTQTLSASGTFDLTNVPSPSSYQIVVTKQGYAPAVQDIDLGGGEHRSGVTINLVPGDGSIAGTVSTGSGPLGAATISASTTSSTVSTVSLASGSFTLNSLETPATFTVLVSAPNFATQTLSLSLAPDQHLTGVNVTLDTGVGSISGTVTAANAQGQQIPAGGVTVTATNGKLAVTAVTLSVGPVGNYTLAGLSVPSTYTVTFSRSDLFSQTQAVSLNSAALATMSGINAAMVSSTATITGTVTALNDQHQQVPTGNATVLLSSGTSSYQTTTADDAANLGQYAIDDIVPGTYTISVTRPGGVPSSSILTLAAGEHLPYDVMLAKGAEISGIVTSVGTGLPVMGAEVRLYLASQFPLTIVADMPTDSNGMYTFPNVDAPQDYVVAFAYPQGSSAQSTDLVTTTPGATTTANGSVSTS